MASKKAKTDDNGVTTLPMSAEEFFAPTTELELKTAKLVRIAQDQIRTSVMYKRNRMDEVQKSIDLYNGKTKKALKGRWNVPLPIMAGYVDTLVSKTDDPPTVRFGYQDAADMQRAAKVQAKFDQDSTAVEGRWAEKDRQIKKIAAFYGVGLSKYFAYNDEKGAYHSHFEVVDPLDFECEPMGGQNLKLHMFKGQRNIFKMESDLLRGATGANATYDKKQVLRLIATVNSNDYKDIEKIWQEKTDRLKSLGFDPDQNNYVGVKTYNLTEWYMKDPETGEDWYLLFEPHSGVWVRSAPLKDVFESGQDPFDAWHTHPDAFNFWSKSPADDMRPVAEGMNIIFNQALDNREKINYTQRAYDPAIFPDPSELEWRPDGLIAVNEGISQVGGGIASGVYSFTTQGMSESGTIDLMKFMDDVTGIKTGITPSAQGETDEKRVGIYYGNLQQVADRLGLYNKSYSEAWGRIGLKYYHGLREHIKSNKLMVQMVGDKGYNWVELVKGDTEPVRDFNITIVGGQAQAAQDELTKKTRMESLALAAKLNRINPDVATEEILRNGGWEEGAVKRLMDMQSYGSEQIISEAHQAIEDILEGRRPKQNRGATTLYIQTIIDYAYDAEDLSDSMFSDMIAFAELHVPIATENAMRKVRMMAAAAGGIADSETPVDPNAPVQVPGSPVADPSLGFNETSLTSAGAQANALNV